MLTEVTPDCLWQPIPAPRDLEITALLESVPTADLLAAIEEAHWDVLCVYAERMAALAVRRRDRGILGNGLLAAALAGLGKGYDALSLLPLFLHAAAALGEDPVELFKTVGREVGAEARQLLESFPLRPEEDRSLAAMGYREAKDEDGFRYLRTW